jgi:hypothetical protein
MGFPFIKKKKSKEPTASAEESVPATAAAGTTAIENTETKTTMVATAKPGTEKPPVGKPATKKAAPIPHTPIRNTKSKHSDAPSTGSKNRRRMFFGKASSPNTPGTPDTEPAATPESVLEYINVRAASAGGDDFEVFMGDYPEEVLLEREMIRKQLFGDEEEEEGEEDEEEHTADAQAAAAANDDAETEDAAKVAESPSSVRKAATTNSQEVSADGNVHDADDDADDVPYEVVPPVKAPTSEPPRTVYERKVPEASPKIQRVRTAAEIAAVAEAIYAVAAITASPNARARGPTTPVVEGKPFDEEIDYEKDEMEKNELFAMKESERKKEEQHLREQDTWSTADSTAKSYIPSLGSSFHPRDNSLMASPSGRSFVSNASDGRSYFSSSEKMTAGKILDALGCRKDTTVAGFSVANMFYDTANACDPTAKNKEPLSRRPYFNEAFAKQFLQKLLTKGVDVLYLQPPGSLGNNSLDWKGRTVTLMIEPGVAGSESAIQPKLEWSTLAGGRTFEIETASLALLRILSITSSAQEMKEDGDDDSDLCFFNVTSDTGDVHIFEASSPEERDEIVNGIKNVIARLTFHLVAGDTTASSELYNANINSKSASVGDLPGLENRKQTMNRIAHTLLA